MYFAGRLTSVLFLFCLLALSGCTGKDGSFDPRKPYSLDLTPPEGPIEYEQGWTDGCESGSQAYSNNFYQLLKTFKFKMDPKLRGNKMYYQAWKDAFLYCAIYWEGINSNRI